ILAIGPCLLDVRESGPRMRPTSGLGLGEGRGEVREGLVQPQVVPPAHRHEIAEPHMGHLVQDRFAAAFAAGVRDLAPENVVLGERHATGILHGAGVNSGTNSWSYLSPK